MVELDESHATLNQAPRHEALLAKRGRDRIVQAVELLHRLGLLGPIDRLRSAALHPVSQLVRRDPRGKLGASRVAAQVEVVELRQEVQPRALLLG